MSNRTKDRGPPKPRQPKKATPAYLERSALFYLERYASSVENLRRKLTQKVQRSAQVHGTDPQAGQEAIAALLERFQRSGLLDDRVYARGRCQSLLRQGLSLRGIRSRLRAKGVAEEIVEEVLEELEEDRGGLDLKAAVAYARKRRIGPYRRASLRAENRERDLAALARRGFSYGTAARVVEAESAESLEAGEGF
ncbi:MAG: RecX family transcriptional regulator [Rhodovibrionaceae bacterium]